MTASAHWIATAVGRSVRASVLRSISGTVGYFRAEWPTSIPVWAPAGQAQQPGTLFRNADPAAT